MPNWKKILLNGGSGELTTLKLTSLTEDSTGTKILTLDSSNNIKLTASFGGGASVGGSDKQVQFNDGGSLGGEAGFTFDKSTDIFIGGNQLRANDAGSATAPAFGWSAQTNTGMYFTYSPNELLFTTAGTERVKIGANTTISSGTIRNTAGTAGAPSYTFSGNTDTGIYGSSVSDQLSITTGGSNRFSVSTTEIQALLPFQSSDGAKSAPQYSFGNDNDTGMYLNGNGILAFATAGDNRLLLSSTYTEVENTLKLDSVDEGSGIQRYLVWDSNDDNSVKWQSISFSGLVDTTTTQTIGGNKTFSNQTSISTPAASGGTLILGRKSSNPNLKSSDAYLIMDSNTNFAAINYYVNQNVMLAFGGGNVGIGTNSASQKLFVNGNTKINTALGVGVNPSSTTGRIDASNDVVAFSTSDERLKKKIKNIKNPLEKICKINGVTFEWKKTDDKIKKEVHSFEGHDVGVLAQEVEKVLPEVVATRDNGYKAVKYEKIVPLLIEAIKEQQKQIDELKSKL